MYNRITMSKLYGGLIKNGQYAGTIIVENYERYTIHYKWTFYGDLMSANLSDPGLACIFELTDELYDKYKDILNINTSTSIFKILSQQDDIKLLLGILDANNCIKYRNSTKFKILMSYEN